jgi:hypothetical protein
MSEIAAAPTSGNSHLPGYMDGAPAADAFQAFVDKGGLLDTTPNAAPEHAPTAPTEAKAPAEQSQAPEPEGAPDAAEAQEAFVNLDDYLKKSGVERESFLQLPVTIKVGGKDEQVALKELLRGYQREADYTQKTQSLAEQRKAWDAEQAQVKQQLTQHFTNAKTLAQLAQNELTAEFQATDWKSLYANDPGRFAAEQQRFAMRNTQIQNALQQVEQAQQAHIAEAQKQQHQIALAERDKMLEHFPEWREPARFQAARTEMSSYAQQLGFTDADLNGITDHRVIRALHDASQASKIHAQKSQALKMVRTAPPMAAPGARVMSDPKAARLQQVREAGKAGRLARDPDAQAAAFSALVNAGI